MDIGTTASRSEAQRPAPGRPFGRVPALDVLRGIAIIGTLASNIWLFQAFVGPRIVGIEWRDILGWLPNGKFLGLLTIMFGIGLEIQRQSAVRHGRRWPGAYLVRAGLLFLDGVLNYVFVVQFDVLRAYAIIAVVVAFVVLLKERLQWWFIGVTLAAHVVLLVLGELVPATMTAIPGFVFPGFPDYTHTPTYPETVWMNLHGFLSDLTVGSDAGTIVVMGLAVFTLGAMLYRHGIFERSAAPLRRWVMAVGFGIGIPADVAIEVLNLPFSYGRYFAATMISFGILALVAWFYLDRPVGFVGRRLTAVGRMALSCYVLQNALGRILQQVIGHSPLTDTLDPVVGTLLMFALITAILIAFSELWLRKFARGPLEAVWAWSYARLTTRGGVRAAR